MCPVCPIHTAPDLRRGFDIDSWRAHLNPLTWPEVARQVAITAGLGRRRPKARKEEKAKLGTEGEDTVQDESGERAAPGRGS